VYACSASLIIMNDASHKIIFSEKKKEHEMPLRSRDLSSLISPVDRSVEHIITPRDYFFFTLAFSLSAAPISVFFSLIPATLNDLYIAGIANSMFCFGYVLGSLFLARPLILRFGSKSALLYGHFGSLLLVFTIFSTMFIGHPVYFPIGAFVGGLFQSIM
jgi:hypothetical protein